MHQFQIKDLFDLQKPGENHAEAIFYLLKYIEGKTTADIKEGIYRNFSCVKWLSDEQLLELLDTLFKHYESDNMEFIDCSAPGALEYFQSRQEYRGIRSIDEFYTIKVREMIGFAICELIKPKLKSHYEKYYERLKSIVTNRHYRGRSGMVDAYVKLGKNETAPDLLKLLEERDSDVLDSILKAVAKLKIKEAKPYLQELLKHDDLYFRDLARKALAKLR